MQFQTLLLPPIPPDNPENKEIMDIKADGSAHTLPTDTLKTTAEDEKSINKKQTPELKKKAEQDSESKEKLSLIFQYL